MRVFMISLFVLSVIGSSGFAAVTSGDTAVYCLTPESLESNLKTGSQLIQTVFDRDGILAKLNNNLPGKSRTFKTVNIFADVGPTASWSLYKERVNQTSKTFSCEYRSSSNPKSAIVTLTGTF